MDAEFGRGQQKFRKINMWLLYYLWFLFFGHLAVVILESTFFVAAPTIHIFLDMFPLKSVNPFILMLKRAFKL